MSDYCKTNECDDPECHRCYPRQECEDHGKCIEFTKSGEAWTEDELTAETTWPKSLQDHEREFNEQRKRVRV